MIALLINQRLTVNDGRLQHAGRFCIENGLLPSDRVIGEPFRVVAGRAFQKQFITYNAFDPCAVRSDDSTSLMYCDYDTMQQILLCSQPNCAHNTAACNGYLPYSAGGIVKSAAWCRNRNTSARWNRHFGLLRSQNKSPLRLRHRKTSHHYFEGSCYE